MAGTARLLRYPDAADSLAEHVDTLRNDGSITEKSSSTMGGDAKLAVPSPDWKSITSSGGASGGTIPRTI